MTSQEGASQNSADGEPETESASKEDPAESAAQAVGEEHQGSVEKASENSTVSGNGGNNVTDKNSQAGNAGNAANSGDSGHSGGNSEQSGSTGGNVSSGNGGSTSASVQESYTAKITLKTSRISVDGSGASVEGTKVRITSGGDYFISGTISDGQIIVDTATEDKVTLILSGVSVTCRDGPAIFVNEAKKCTVELVDGTTSALTDGGSDKINDGVIFSNDTLRIRGNGALDITSRNAHGIAGDDDVIIESGRLNIKSVKSGIFAHDDITISGGELKIAGGTNGIKSKGTLNITGGTSVITGGTKEEKSSVYAEADFNYTGGYVYAAGNKVSQPTSSAYPYVIADVGDSGAAGAQISVFLNGSEAADLVSENAFRCVMVLSPEFAVGGKFSLKLNGTDKGDCTIAAGQNIISAK